MSFGPGGLLLVTEPRHAAIVAIETGDTGPVQKLKQRVDNVGALLAARLGAPEGGVTIADLAVNQASGKIYLAVTRKADGASNYATTDLATALYRLEHFHANGIVVVTDYRQADHFEQLYLTVRKWFEEKHYRIPELH
ncbi:MAG: arginine--tRNA ligase, partial [Verrucomicrobia bacterium]|nr:arginine--tRNA ligase [Verrucomicrobiota bacterium]